jgi:simple sugar transport system ATP-binding protein
MLELRAISKRFGPVLANDGVSIVVRTGTIHAIVGENGAGKSTAMRIAFGLYRPDSGEVVINGTPRPLRGPADAIALGVGMVHQHFMLVDPMTVVENIVLGAEGGARLDLAAATEEVRRLSQELGLAVEPGQRIEDLSVGQQQRVELLKALYRRAQLLILDEPTAVLTPPEVDELFAILRRMREQGKTIVIITHKLAEVLALSDEVTVMRDGRVVGSRPTAATNAADLARLMVGRDVLLRVDKTPAHPGADVLEVDRLTVRDAEGVERLRDVSLSVRAGEIVGIAGVEGNGQTELIEALAGLVPRSRQRGHVRLAGREIGAASPRQRRRAGIAHVPEDRHRRGLLLDFDLAENAILGVADGPPVARPSGLLDRAAIAARVQRILREFDVRPPHAELPARALSGGNQQKLVIGRELSGAPKVLLVSQPTRGVDIGAIEFIHRELIALRDRGCAILLVSAELDEARSLADRLLVMHRGQVVGELDPQVATTEQIGILMACGAPAASDGAGRAA